MTKSNDHSDKPAGQSDKRRSVLKKILASGGVITVGSGLSDRWQKPVLNAVTLPAHASMTPKAESAG